MKKILALFLAITMVMGIIPVVSAAIPQNNGNGTVLTFKEWSKSKPSSGTYCTISSVSDDTFVTVTRYTSTGTPNGNDYTQYKQLINFSLPESISAPVAGDRVMVSFYYRINTGDGYVAPLTFTGANALCKDATTGKSFGDVSILNKWQYVSYISTIDSSLKGAPDVRQVFRFTTSANTDKISVDIAEPKAVYMGAVTAEDNATINEQIASALSTTAITGITVGGTVVDLTANPTSYMVEEAVAAEDITVTTKYGTADKVVIEEAQDGTSVTVKVYAPYVDWNASGATPSVTYTINVKQEEPVYVNITENNGKGTGVIIGHELPEYVGSAGRQYNKIETIKGDSTSPFDEYYSWTREEFTVESTSNTSYLALSGTVPDGAAKGDWVYVSFYYRNYNRFTNSAGQVVNNNGMDITPSIRTNNIDFSLYDVDVNNRKYIRLAPDPDATNDVGEWKKITYIQKIANDNNDDINANWTLKISNTHTKNPTAGTVSGTNRKIDFADIKVAYFGTPTVQNAEPGEEDAAIIEAIKEAAGNYGLTDVYVNEKKVNTESNPTSYTLTAPRLTARENLVNVVANSIHGAGMTYVTENNDVYTIKSLPLDYDWLSGTDNRVAMYTVNEIAEYDFYDFSLDGTTLSLKADIGAGALFNGVLIGASYGENNKLLKMTAETLSNLTGNANELSVTVPDATETVKSLKFFVWDSLTSTTPYVKSILVEDFSKGTITQ